MSGLKESRKKIQRSIEFLAQHAEINRSAALHELLQVSKTLVRCLNEVNDPGKAFRFFLLDKDEDDANASNTSATEEDTTYGEKFRQAVSEAEPATIKIFDEFEDVNNELTESQETCEQFIGEAIGIPTVL